MNGYERITAALKGEKPDRRPVMLHNFRVAAREAGYTMKQYREDPATAARCHIRFVEKYEVDGILFDVDTALTAGALGAAVDYPENEPARIKTAFLRSLDEADRLNDIDIASDRRIRHSLETVSILKKYFRKEIFIRGNCDQAPFSLACSLRTPACFMMDLITEPEKALRLIDCAAGICARFIRLMAEAGADMISNGDSPAGPSMISPAMYQTFAMPYEQQMSDIAHDCGTTYLVHICGNTDRILEPLAAMRLDAAELDYQTPVDRIVTCFRENTTLFGTVDPSGTLASGTPATVCRETRKILAAYKQNFRLVIGAGCAIPPDTPEENLRAIIRTAREDEL